MCNQVYQSRENAPAEHLIDGRTDTKQAKPFKIGVLNVRSANFEHLEKRKISGHHSHVSENGNGLGAVLGLHHALSAHGYSLEVEQRPSDMLSDAL